MIGMEMREDDGVQRLVAKLLQRFCQRGTGGCIAAIDQNQAFIGLEDHHIDDGKAQQPGTRSHGLYLESGSGICDGVLVGSAVHAVGHCIRQLGAKAAAFHDGPDHLWIGLEHLGAGGKHSGAFRSRTSAIILIVGVGRARTELAQCQGRGKGVSREPKCFLHVGHCCIHWGLIS